MIPENMALEAQEQIGELIQQLEELGRYDPRWPKDAHTWFSHSGGRVSLSSARSFFNKSVRLAEEAAAALRMLTGRDAHGVKGGGNA